MERVSRRDFLKIIVTLLCYPSIKPLVQAACSPAIYWHGNQETQSIAITFDDCNNYDHLCELESLLDANAQVQVTFFPTGRGLQNSTSKDPEIWKRLLNKGHEIGYHSFTHAQPSGLSMSETIQEYIEWKNTLAITNEDLEIKFARPPYGDLGWKFLNLCCNQNLTIVMWSQNWALLHKTNFRELNAVQSGDIILMHLRKQDIQNFKDCIPLVHEMGLKMVNLTSLIFQKEEKNRGKPETDNTEDLCSKTLRANLQCPR